MAIVLAYLCAGSLIAGIILLATIENKVWGFLLLVLSGVFLLIPCVGNTYDQTEVDSYVSTRFSNITFERPVTIFITKRTTSAWWTWKYMNSKETVEIKDLSK